VPFGLDLFCLLAKDEENDGTWKSTWIFLDALAFAMSFSLFFDVIKKGRSFYFT